MRPIPRILSLRLGDDASQVQIGEPSRRKGADRIWLSIVGPGTPAKGEIDAAAEQRDIAPTILKLMGIDPAEYKGATGKPIPVAIR